MESHYPMMTPRGYSELLRRSLLLFFIIFYCVYRPPDTDLNNFNESMANTLVQISKEGKMCYILGDYNINLFKSETHSPTQDFLNVLYSNYFYPIIHKPTRVAARSATLIDNILNCLNKVPYSDVGYYFRHH